MSIIDLPVDLVEDASRTETKCKQGITKIMNSFTAIVHTTNNKDSMQENLRCLVFTASNNEWIKKEGKDFTGKEVVEHPPTQETKKVLLGQVQGTFSLIIQEILIGLNWSPYFSILF